MLSVDPAAPLPLLIAVAPTPRRAFSAATGGSSSSGSGPHAPQGQQQQPQLWLSVPPTPMSSSSYEAGSGLSQVSVLAVNGLLTRCLTFGLNLFVARSVSPAVFGLQAVHLYLLNTAILFLSREATRKATIRYACRLPDAAFASPAASSSLSASLQRSRYERQQVVNLGWLSVALAAVLTVVLTAAFYASAPAAALELGYRPSVLLFGAATLLEMTSEPLFCLAARSLLVRCRVGIESAATLLRCLVTVAAVVWLRDSRGLLAFAYGQLAFSATTSLAFYLYYLTHIARGDGQQTVGVQAVRELLPAPVTASASPSLPSASRTVSGWLDRELLSLWLWLVLQMAEKLALTEGEKAVMVGLSFSLDQQGVYGLVQNLGSLLARLLFSPLEEAAATEFSLLFASVAQQQRPADSGRKLKQEADSRSGRDDVQPLLSSRSVSASSAASPSSAVSSRRVLAAYSVAAQYLGLLLKLLLLLSLTLLSLGPPFSFPLISLLYGERWSRSAAPQVLSAYCLYLGFMAVNGLTEAFVTAVTSAGQMAVYNLLLLAFSLLYLTACAALLRFGALGLVAANCFNMAMRIAYSLTFTRSFFASAPALDEQTRRALPLRILSTASPAAAVWLAFLAAAAACLLSERVLGLDAASSSSSSAPMATGLPLLLSHSPHLACGVLSVAVLAAVCWGSEREFALQLVGLLSRRKRAQRPTATAAADD